LLLGWPANAQQLAPRIAAEINSREWVPLRGSHSPLARPENESGRVSPEARLEGISIVFSRTDAQEKDLQELIAAQQDPASPHYHQWLTPEQFGARFGLADADVTAVESWLAQQGFTMNEVARSKNQIRFSGTVQQAEQAFGTELHYYSVNGERHFAPNSDLALPASLAPVVLAVTNLSTFRPRSHMVRKGAQSATQYHFTSGQTGNHFLTPKDVATIYNISPAYSAGLTGSGQSIAVVGQSEIVMTDIEHFQTASQVFTTPKDPIRKLVPSSGTATIVTGDESESDLDLEYASTMAPGATIYFYYTGNAANFNVWNSIETAIQDDLAQIISSSYGVCEPLVPQSFYNSLNGTFLAQAASQGQTVISAAGDGGSADCYNPSAASPNTTLAVDFPASSQYVTGIGGTEFPAADVASGSSTYFSSNGSSDVISSALSYIPEQVWNDSTPGNGSTPATISAGGGGISISSFTPRPSWQTGVTGIPSGTSRLVPDISLSSSPNNAGYLYCSSDTSTKVTGSCANGFRDTNNTNLTVAGGTSFGAPIFAGMMALINQKTGSAQGLANTKLYGLAASATTYASAFHDITNGNNNCSAAGTTLCPASIAAATKYSATPGYDMASGLGSVNFNNLLAAWSGGSSASKSFTLAATDATIAAGSTGTSTVTITPQNGYTGTIAWTVSSAPSSADLCFAMSNATVSGTSAVTASLTIKTSASACGTGAIAGTTGKRQFAMLLPAATNDPKNSRTSLGFAQTSLGLVAVLLIGFAGRRYQRLRLAGCSLLLIAAGMATSGCSSSAGGSSGGGGGNAAKGNYTVTIRGTDTTTSSITASTTLTLTID
jgi:subtilase family serine protease